MLPLFLGSLFKIGAGLLGAASKRKAARAEAAAYEFNAKQVEARTVVDTLLRERAGVREAGTIAAAAGGSGLAGGGSAANIIRESTRNTMFDLASIKTQGDLESKKLRSAAKSAKAGGNLGAAGTLLSTGASLLK